MASTTWRMTGIQTHGGGDLELSELRLWGETSALDGAGVTLRSSHPPTSGSLENLRDDDFDTTCRWSAEIVQSPGFYIEWETPTAVFAWCVRLAAPSKEVSVGAYSLNMLSPTGWLCAENGWLEYQAGLSDAREVRPTYGVQVRWSQPAGPVAGTSGFAGAAVSADGQTIVVAGYGGSTAKVNISNDGGVSWSQPTGPVAGTIGFIGAAVSADGQTIVVTGQGNSAAKVSISNDGGVSWSQPAGPVAGTGGFAGAAVSADGQTIVVTGAGNSAAKVSISNDGGVSWSQPAGPVAGTGGVSCAAVSADGQTIVVAGYGSSASKVSISNDGGVSWSQPAGPVAGTSGFAYGAISADGQTIVVAERGSSATKVSISNDGGVSWSQPAGPVAGTSGFAYGAISADGQTIMFAGLGSSAAKVSISNDGGVSWSQPAGPVAGTGGFIGGAISADGQMIVVTGYGSSAARVSIFLATDPMYVDQPVVHHAQPQLALPSTTPPAPQGLGPTDFYRPLKALDAEFGGKGRIYGTVTRKNLPANVPMKRRVRLHRSVDGLLVRETWSDTAGNYEFREINPRYEYDVFAWDHEMMFRTVVANNLKPEV